MMKKKFKFHKQLDHMDCGPTCLKMIASYYGKDYSLDFLRANSFITRQGVNLLGLSEAAEKIGIKTLGVKVTINQLVEDVPLPCILHWNQEHFVVLYDIQLAKDGILSKKKKLKFLIADPGHNLISIDQATFSKFWLNTGDKKGVALILEPTIEFYNQEENQQTKSSGFKFLFKYIAPYKKYVVQVIIGMLLSSLIALIFPFLTQSMVDFGIQRHNIDFIYLVLFSQLFLFVGGMTVDMIRNWMLLHINTRVSVTIISNFLVKLMKLPISYFESKNVGDITQRINDHHRIETFLTGSTLSTLFSIINILIFSIVLGSYNVKILAIFGIGSAISIAWVLLFLKKRKDLDYVRFQRMRENQNTIYELVTSMQEIKLNNCERTRRWEWERIQARLFKVNIQSLALEQYQEIGSSFVTQLKNILISSTAAFLVINNSISLGVMLSISYVVGQMNNPLNQIIGFVRSVQDAKISLERLSEIHDQSNEEIDLSTKAGKVNKELYETSESTDNVINSQIINGKTYNTKRGIHLDNVSFQYGGSQSVKVLKNINLFIPEGKVTAIVGSSGSGKSTLLKLLLKFYPPTEGQITVNESDILDLSARDWRKICGTVMQEGYIFSDTISRNIAANEDTPNEEILQHAIHVANIQDYIKKLPLGLTTKIGNTGTGMSGGQKQRIFIARAVYKQPKYLFFDEATSALDANNETVIMQNLHDFFKGRTVLVIAHRLSTVKNADQIVVMENGTIIEVGNHLELVQKRGKYYELVKNQLELDAA